MPTSAIPLAPWRPRMNLRCAVTLVLVLGASACGEESVPVVQADPDAGVDAGAAAGPRPSPCAPGELVLERGGCLPAGVPPEACGEGFAANDDRTCEPILPPAPCSAGTMAIPGDTSCRNVAPCTGAPWGGIPIDATTQFVDASYAGGGSIGTQAMPWTTVQAGVDAAAPGAIVAIAKGSYAEQVVVETKPVRLWGSCPVEVEIAGIGATAAIAVGSGSDGTEIRALAVTGDAVGVSIHAEGVAVDRVWIHDTVSWGLMAEDLDGPASADVEGSLVETASGGQIRAFGATVDVDQSALRDSPLGMIAADDAATGVRGHLTLRRSIVERARTFGVASKGGDVTVEESVVSDTLPDSTVEDLGIAIAALPGNDPAQRPSVTVRRSVVERCREFGLWLADADAELEATVVRDVSPAPDGTVGMGIGLFSGAAAPAARPILTIRSSVVERGRTTGVAVIGADATVEATIVRDIESQASDGRYGRGISVEGEPTSGARGSLALRGSIVERSREVGLVVLGADAEVDGTAVRETRPQAADGQLGRGITVQAGGGATASKAVIRTSLIEGSHELALAAVGANLSVEDTVVRATVGQMGTELFGDGIVASAVLSTGSPLPTSVRLERCRVEGSSRAGVSNFGASITIAATVLQCNAIDLDGESFGDLAFAFEDLGGNVCGCAGETRPCIVLSTGLAAPEPVAE